MQGRNVLENFFEFYALLATLFSLTIGHAQQPGARRYVRTFTARKPGWRMLLMPPQLPGEGDLSLVAVRRADCEKDESEALARCRDYEAKEARKKKET